MREGRARARGARRGETSKGHQHLFPSTSFTSSSENSHIISNSREGEEKEVEKREHLTRGDCVTSPSMLACRAP